MTGALAERVCRSRRCHHDERDRRSTAASWSPASTSRAPGGRAGVHPRRRRRLRLVVQHRQRRDRRAHELRRHAHVDQQRQRAERLGPRPPRDHGRHDRRGLLDGQFTGAQPPAHGAARRDASRSTPTARTACDDIKELLAERHRCKTIVNARTALGGTAACHLNNIQYSPTDDTLVFSDLDNNVLTKVTRTDGAMVWILNGARPGSPTRSPATPGPAASTASTSSTSTTSSSSTTTAPTAARGAGSIAIEMKLDTARRRRRRSGRTRAEHPCQTDVMGDVQRLPNGNTIVGYSTKGIDPRGRRRAGPCCRRSRTRRQLRLHREARDAVRSVAEVTRRQVRA